MTSRNLRAAAVEAFADEKQRAEDEKRQRALEAERAAHERAVRLLAVAQVQVDGVFGPGFVLSLVDSDSDDLPGDGVVVSCSGVLLYVGDATVTGPEGTSRHSGVWLVTGRPKEKADNGAVGWSIHRPPVRSLLELGRLLDMKGL